MIVERYVLFLFLAPFLTYEFRVQAETIIGVGNFSDPRRFETDEFGKQVNTYPESKFLN